MIQDSRSRFNNRKGFTLTEFLIVIALVAIISTIGLVNLYGKKSRENFDNVVIRFVTIFEQAISNSVTQKNLSGIYGDWRVRLVPSDCVGGPSIALQFYDIGASGKWVAQEYFVLPDGIDFDRAFTFFPGPCDYTLPEPYKGKYDSNSVIAERLFSFEKSTGIPGEDIHGFSPAARIYLKSQPSISSTISISPLGQITYTIDGGVLSN